MIMWWGNFDGEYVTLIEIHAIFDFDRFHPEEVVAANCSKMHAG